MTEKFKIEFDYDDLPKCECKKEKSFLYMNNGYGGARYLCPDCAYHLGYINGYGYNTVKGNNANIRCLIVKE